MKKSTAFLLALATVAIILGGILFVIAMSANGWDFSKISTAKPETNSYEFEGNVTDISMSLDTEDVVFLPSSDGKIKVVCNESDNLKHSVTLQDGKLNVTRSDTRKWYNYIFNFTNNKITVYLPTSTYASLNVKADTSDIELAQGLIFKSIDVSVSTGKVNCYSDSRESTKITASTGDVTIANKTAGSITLKTSTGNINLSNVVATDVSFSVSTGDASLNNVSCANLITSGSTGKINMTGVFVSSGISIERSTGDVSFSACDAADTAKIYIKTSTGSVKGSFLSDKIFFYDTDTGKVEIPRTTSGAVCDIKTDTGDIKISISK